MARELKLTMLTQLVKKKKILVTKHKNVERFRRRTLTFPLEMNTGLPEDGGALYIYVTSEKDERKKEIHMGTHSAFGGWPLHNVEERASIFNCALEFF